MNKQYKLTAEGIKELEQEQEKLMAQRGPIAERIATAREFGDLSENAEYSAARLEMERAESRISEIASILKNVEEIKTPKNKDTVELGNTVKLNGKSKKEFTIVGSVEADPMNGKISDESPIGQALVGKKLGEEVEIVTPVETAKYKIESIS